MKIICEQITVREWFGSIYEESHLERTCLVTIKKWKKFIAWLGIYSPEISMFFVGNVAVRSCRDEFQIFAKMDRKNILVKMLYFKTWRFSEKLPRFGKKRFWVQ